MNNLLAEISILMGYCSIISENLFLLQNSEGFSVESSAIYLEKYGPILRNYIISLHSRIGLIFLWMMRHKFRDL